jgi:hypothetical protein
MITPALRDELEVIVAEYHHLLEEHRRSRKDACGELPEKRRLPWLVRSRPPRATRLRDASCIEVRAADRLSACP